MIVITSPINTEIILNVSGHIDNVNKLNQELSRISMCSSFLWKNKGEDEIYAKIKLLISLKDVNKAKKIIDKHTQYFTNIKKYKNKTK